MNGDNAYPCGQCLPCRINRRRLWTHRLILEALKHEYSIFVTLTYDKNNYPPDGSLQPRELQLFLKKLRQAVAPIKIRFYAVGEYGDLSGRAHYHLAIFGLNDIYAKRVTDSWGKGMVHIGNLTLESAQYICGYTTKKLTSKDDPKLEGKHPEFARMSLRPAIGLSAMEDMHDFLTTEEGSKHLLQTKDVPLFLRHGGKNLPLGRYLRSKLREKLDIPQSVATQNPQYLELQKEMSDMFEASSASNRWSKLRTYQKSTKSKIASVETKFKIYQSKAKKL